MSSGVSTDGTREGDEPASTADVDPDESTGELADEDDEAEREVVELDLEPPRLVQSFAAGAAVVGTALAAPFATLSIPFGLAGLIIVLASLFVTYTVGWLTLGIGLILLAGLISGVFGALPAELMLMSLGATILAWDAGQYGIVLGQQLGRQTYSRRNQVVHVAGNTLVVGLISTFVYLVYLFGGDGRPASAVSVVVIGLIMMAWVLRS